ncbi:MAG: Uma2 family endonuclease [Deltaproteobacteria bacterium]|nr:Uma2 family endonuclease [Deltaproteobacteria bacterium]
MTEAEFLRLPESNQCIELVDGEVIVSPSPSFRHQKVLRRLTTKLTNWAERQSRTIEIGQSPSDVRIAPGRIVQPDAFVLLDHAIPRDHVGPLDRVPELCIEIVSSDRVYDRVTKRLLYAAAGVQEYWVVDPVGVVERWSGAGLVEAEELRERLTTPLLPGFELDLVALFA